MIQKIGSFIKRHLVTILILILFFIIVFLFIFISKNNSSLDISINDKYVSFSSIIAAVIGGLFTIFGVGLGNNASMHQINEQMRLTHLPCLSVKLLDKKEGNEQQTFYCGDYYGNVHVNKAIEVMNVGVGGLKDFSFSVISENKSGCQYIPVIQRLSTNESTIISYVFQYNEEHARRFVDPMNRDQVIVEFRYRDLLGNQYNQQFSLMIGFYLGSENNINSYVNLGRKITEPIVVADNYNCSFFKRKNNRQIKQRNSINEKINSFSNEKQKNVQVIKLSEDEQMKLDILNRQVSKLLENEKEILRNRLLRYGPQGGRGYNSSIIKKHNNKIEITKVIENSNADGRFMLSYEHKEVYNLKKGTCKIRRYKIRYQAGLTFAERYKLRYVYRHRTLREDDLKYIDAFDVNNCLFELDNWKTLETWQIEQRLKFLFSHSESLNRSDVSKLVFILYCLNACKIISQELFLTGKAILLKYIVDKAYDFSYEELTRQVSVPFDIELIKDEIKAFMSEIASNLVPTNESNLIREWINQIGSFNNYYLISNANQLDKPKVFFSKISKRELILVLNRATNGEFNDFTSFIYKILCDTDYTKSDLNFLNSLALDLKDIHYSDTVKLYLKTVLIDCINKKWEQMNENG